uniref:Class I SAM-dependent rRNA methyltransferase n=1 Tax=Schlesneria paludicola TaxID=360056 RepID=A0A7C4QRS1_9PLAN
MKRPARKSAPRVAKRPLAELLRQRPLADGLDAAPEIEVRAPTPHPFLYRKRLGQFPPQAMPGDVVRLRFANGDVFGWGLFNPHAEIAVRVLRHGPAPPDETWWLERLQAAANLRRHLLHLDEATDAYRVVHAEGDGLSGLIVDRLGDVLALEAFSLGMYQRGEALLEGLGALVGTRYGVLRAGPHAADHEGFAADPVGSEDLPSRIVVREFGTKFRVDFTAGQKTGFYCDQRENRRRFADFCRGRSVLDVCSYTGGFALQAARIGPAREVTGVELDESAVRLARENARLNHLKQVHFVQADAFAYVRDMLRNQRTYQAVVLDPPKLIRTREELSDGRRKYFDLNRLALQVVEPGGLLLTCSCSGLLDMGELTRLVGAAAHDVQRRIQILAKGGAAADHPLSPICPESEYLKALWLRVE